VTWNLRLAGAALALGLVAGVALAAEKAEIPPDVDAKALKSAQERFKRSYDTADIDFKLEALKKYASVQHKTIAKHLVKLLREDDPNVRAEIAKGLGKQRSSAATVGKKLVKLIDETDRDDEQTKVVRGAVIGIDRLGYVKADSTLKSLIHHHDDTVVAAVFRTYGHWESDLAIREMLNFFKKYPDEKSFATGSVSVDTGSAGNADASAAKAKWKSKYGGQRGWRPRPECTRGLIEALKEITGHGFRRPEDLEDYLKDPKKYVDPETITERMDEGTRREVYARWVVIKGKAAELAKKEVKGDEEAADQRSKVYRKHLYELRGELMDKHDLKLSELDVIVETGEAERW
jgi:hypothetical protein